MLLKCCIELIEPYTSGTRTGVIQAAANEDDAVVGYASQVDSVSSLTTEEMSLNASNSEPRSKWDVPELTGPT